MYPDRSTSIFIELRRHHVTYAQCDNKEFIVTRRLGFRPPVIVNKSFGSFREAKRYWGQEVSKLEDQGLIRHDMSIVGFHEEG